MKKLFMIYVIALVTILAFPISSNAEESELYFVENNCNLNVSIFWDIEQPQLTIVSPDGEEILVFEEENENLTVSGKVASFLIPNATTGQWLIDVSDDKNKNLQVYCGEYIHGISIKNFNTEKIDSNTMNISFETNRDDNYNYEITAVSKNSDIVLLSGTSADFNVENIVYLNDLSPFDIYNIQLKVSLSDVDYPLNDFAITSKFMHLTVSSYGLISACCGFGLVFASGAFWVKKQYNKKQTYLKTDFNL